MERTRVHDLRHAAASYLVGEGVDRKVIQVTLRHANSATTDLYMHVFAEVQRTAADAMDRVLKAMRA